MHISTHRRSGTHARPAARRPRGHPSPDVTHLQLCWHLASGHQFLQRAHEGWLRGDGLELGLVVLHRHRRRRIRRLLCDRRCSCCARNQASAPARARGAAERLPAAAAAMRSGSGPLAVQVLHRAVYILYVWAGTACKNGLCKRLQQQGSLRFVQPVPGAPWAFGAPKKVVVTSTILLSNHWPSGQSKRPIVPQKSMPSLFCTTRGEA